MIALATFKFMIAPVYGRGIGLSFWESYITLEIGGIGTALIFFFGSNRLMERAKAKKELKRKLALEKNLRYEEPKKFTWLNKRIVLVRRNLGFFACSFFFPFFLSVPLGTIVATKFYGKHKLFLLVVFLGLLTNGLVANTIIYLF